MVNLPWLDVEHAILIAIAHYAGDDTAIALDYRSTSPLPASSAATSGLSRTSTAGAPSPPTFSPFAEALGFDDPSLMG